MIEIGTEFNAVVTRVEQFGIFLKHNGEDVVVLLPEFSWQPVHDLKQVVHAGDQLRVMALRYNYQKRQIVGSVRRLHPENNPYREIARLEPGEVLQGQVTSNAGADLTIRLANGAWGYLPKRCLQSEPKIGDTISVEVDCIEVDEGRLTLAPTNKTRQNGDGSAELVSASPVDSTG